MVWSLHPQEYHTFKQNKTKKIFHKYYSYTLLLHTENYSLENILLCIIVKIIIEIIIEIIGKHYYKLIPANIIIFQEWFSENIFSGFIHRIDLS